MAVAGQGDGRPRVALFGGSFDPPHRGHVAVAAAAADAFSLTSVILTPTGLQPLKPKGATASYLDRLAMVSALCGLDQRFCVSALDAPRKDRRPNYTVDTLEALRELMPETELYAIAGADSFLELPRWHRAARLLELAIWIVVSRPGFSLDQIAELALPANAPSRVHVMLTVHERVSATELRARLSRGEDCSDAVPGPVMEYIRARGLYR